MTTSVPKVIGRVKLGLTHPRTGSVRHYRNDELLTRPFALIIVQFSAGEYNLIHLNKAGEEMTDTFHESLEAALHQAEIEFMVKPEDWLTVEEPYR